jgi:hypothetical protein
VVLPSIFEHVGRPAGRQLLLTRLTFPQFEGLPANALRRLFELIFYQSGRPIHAISRLDPYYEPLKAPDHGNGLLHRFHIGTRRCNVTFTAKEPGELLDLLLVCKRWAFIGIHAFYGLNTFAFSSLGEFGRFCKGIGEPRVQRLQRLDMLWMGSQYLTSPKNSVRTWAVSWLCETRRLRSLVVHVNETAKQYLRRQYEENSMILYMAQKTQSQPNYRMTRSLRTLQGLDYIHQLRGMQFVEFYDFNKSLELGLRQPVRDWTFVEDIRRVITQPKIGRRAEDAELTSLMDCVPDFGPSESEYEIISPWFSHDADIELGPLDAVIHQDFISPAPTDNSAQSDNDDGGSNDGDEDTLVNSEDEDDTHILDFEDTSSEPDSSSLDSRLSSDDDNDAMSIDSDVALRFGSPASYLISDSDIGSEVKLKEEELSQDSASDLGSSIDLDMDIALDSDLESDDMKPEEDVDLEIESDSNLDLELNYDSEVESDQEAQGSGKQAIDLTNGHGGGSESETAMPPPPRRTPVVKVPTDSTVASPFLTDDSDSLFVSQTRESERGLERNRNMRFSTDSSERAHRFIIDMTGDGPPMTFAADSTTGSPGISVTPSTDTSSGSSAAKRSPIDDPDIGSNDGKLGSGSPRLPKRPRLG